MRSRSAVSIKEGCGLEEAHQTSAVIASRNARGIFLEPRTFVVTNVVITKLVVTSHTHTMSAPYRNLMSRMCPATLGFLAHASAHATARLRVRAGQGGTRALQPVSGIKTAVNLGDLVSE
jgi:hypothetical protein